MNSSSYQKLCEKQKKVSRFGWAVSLLFHNRLYAAAWWALLASSCLNATMYLATGATNIRLLFMLALPLSMLPIHIGVVFRAAWQEIAECRHEGGLLVSYADILAIVDDPEIQLRWMEEIKSVKHMCLLLDKPYARVVSCIVHPKDRRKVYRYLEKSKNRSTTES